MEMLLAVKRRQAEFVYRQVTCALNRLLEESTIQTVCGMEQHNLLEYYKFLECEAMRGLICG